MRIVFPARGDEFGYLGSAIYYVHMDGISKTERLKRDMFRALDRVMRPWWCPRFVLRAMPYEIRNSILRGQVTYAGWKAFPSHDEFEVRGVFPFEAYAIIDYYCNLIGKR